MRTIFIALAASFVISASVLAGCMAAPDSSATTTDPSTGEAASAVRFSPFYPLINVRSGPGFQFPIMYQIPGGTDLPISCRTFDASGTQWYRVSGGGYVLASLAIQTPFIPMCVGVGFAPGAGGPGGGGGPGPGGGGGEPGGGGGG